MVEVLARRRKYNPVLIGEPGVGKTAVFEGLVQRTVPNSRPSLCEYAPRHARVRRPCQHRDEMGRLPGRVRVCRHFHLVSNVCSPIF